MNFFSFFKRLIRYLLRGRRKHYIVSDKRRLVYILNPKVCSTSIRYAFRDEVDLSLTDISVENQVKLALKQYTLTKEQQTYTRFSFVRNPFDRLVSCYVHRVKNKPGTDTKLIRGWHWIGATIGDDETFESFVDKVCRIPDIFANVHFRSQYTFLFQAEKPLYDFLGKFESFDSDMNRLVNRFQLCDVPHANKTVRGDWRGYYTRQLAEKVYIRYKKDITLFGYEEAYHDLFSYLDSHQR